MSDASLNMLGMAKKAGMLEAGEESVADAVRSGKARLILSAADASERSLRHAKTLSEERNITYMVLPYAKADIGAIVGRGEPGILAITQIGMAAGFAAKLDAAYPGKYTQQLEALTEKSARRSLRKKPTTKNRAAQANVGKGKRRMNI